MRKVVSIIGWIVLLAAFSSLGFGTDNPSVGVPSYAIFFLIIFGGVFLYNKKHQKRQEISSNVSAKLYQILGIILLIIAVLSPAFILKSANFLFFIYVIITLITGILIALGALSISIINSSKSIKLLGYLMLVAISVVPALAIMQHDSSYNALGTAYYAAIVVAVFSWWGFSLFSRK